jgi:hypothetical protein
MHLQSNLRESILSLASGFLSGGFRIADGLLGMALAFLDRTFTLHLIGANGFADALLGLAHILVRSALDLV